MTENTIAATDAALANDRFLRALRRQPVDRTPIWLMRQAGRYLPEYRETRRQAGSFLGLAKNPELACEVTLQPLRRFPLDAAILFSDILTVPDAMGLGLYFEDGEGPKFERPIRTPQDIERLAVPDMEMELRYVMDAVRTIRHELNGQVPLIGFSGSPWTLACYMVEGGGSKDFAKVKSLALNAPEQMHKLLQVVTDSVIAYLKAQRAAGAQALQIFDTWGGVLSPRMYREFSLQYMAQISKALKQDGDAPVILFGKGNGLHLEALADTGADAVGIDWTVDLGDAARRIGNKVALQGNLDPVTLYATPEAIAKEAAFALDSYMQGNGGSRDGHVFNLGHGMSPDMSPDHVAALVEAVHNHSRR
ncbi:uroporphyrinogen decarboxylase [Luteimonas sp. FXH3W]|uniref:Uroporphyrinogen decarboxylase n=1 Tax=Aquilutibacter rugosus TaxID=3115820 RepID=A0ABU7UYE5_9GAMM